MIMQWSTCHGYFNEPVGRAYLSKCGVPEKVVENLDLLGFLGDIQCAISN